MSTLMTKDKYLVFEPGKEAYITTEGIPLDARYAGVYVAALHDPGQWFLRGHKGDMLGWRSIPENEVPADYHMWALIMA